MALPVLKLLLASVNMAVLCMVVTLFLNHISSQNDLRSWAPAFYLLASIWLVLRGIFWITTITYGGFTSASFYMLYWLPNPIQFANYLLLPLFFGQVLSSRRKWPKTWRYIRPIYIALTASMVSFMVLSSIKAAILERQEYKCLTEHKDSSDHLCYHALYQVIYICQVYQQFAAGSISAAVS
jgi:hypothetical protein